MREAFHVDDQVIGLIGWQSVHVIRHRDFLGSHLILQPTPLEFLNNHGQEIRPLRVFSRFPLLFLSMQSPPSSSAEPL